MTRMSRRSSGNRRWYAAPLLALLAVSVASCGVIGGNKKPKNTPTLGNRMPVLSRIESGAKVDPSLATVEVVLPTAETNAEWGQPGGNAGKSYGNLALAANPTRAWTASIAGSKPSQRLAAAPVIGGGQLFAFDTSGEVHAFDATTGAPKWSVKLRMEENNSSLFGGGVSYADGKVYVTTGLGEVAEIGRAHV